MNFLAGEISGDNVHLPIGDVRIPDELRHRLESGPGGGRRGVVAGLRPERFEDASLVADRGVTFRAKIDVLESMGSEFYAYFVVESEAVSSRELDELAADAGGADLPTTEGGIQVTARLGAESRVQQGAEAELWFDSTHLQLFDPSRDGVPRDGRGPDVDAGPGGNPAASTAGQLEPRRRTPPACTKRAAGCLISAADAGAASTGLPGMDAQHDFLRARRRATIAKLMARLRGEPSDVGVVLPYEEVIDALGFVSEHRTGLHGVPLDAIVGSVDRGRDFDRRFRPTWAALGGDGDRSQRPL